VGFCVAVADKLYPFVALYRNKHGIVFESCHFFEKNDERYEPKKKHFWNSFGIH